MRGKIVILLIVFSLVIFWFPIYSQEETGNYGSDQSVMDSLGLRGLLKDAERQEPHIVLSHNQALEFLEKKYQEQQWKDRHHPFRRAIGQLIHKASNPPFDSAKNYLQSFPYDSIHIPWDEFYIWEPFRLAMPFITQPPLTIPRDSLILNDTSGIKVLQDSLSLRSLQLIPYPSSLRSFKELKDTTILVIVDTLREVTSSYPEFPFRYYNFPYQADSLKAAISSLLTFVEGRDSSIIYFTGIGNDSLPVWINSRTGNVLRYWLKNDLNDSVTVWIGNPSRNTIGLYLEQGVSFRRPAKQDYYSDPSIKVRSLDKTTLLEIQKIAVKQQYWKYRTEASFSLNQASLTNWVKGGESNVSTSLDITGYADYDNKYLNLSSNNFARIKYGLIASGDKGIRKNLDLLETNSKLNHKAFGKFDFSGILLFKTQIARGYNYPNDSIPVSKFMNPGILTVGFGLDYKPDKNTSINLSLLSYKGTFVPDTAKIDQTKYGIAENKRSKNEPGASFMLSNKFNPFEDITVTNRLQLFTNYINNPENIDIDWEVIVTASLNWFTDVRFNTHFIFDDDTKTPVLDEDRNPVLMPDGTPKKTSRIQFKELLGFSLVFRF
jgi:hypothetical protein